MASVSSAKRGRGQQKYYWTTTEDTILVESLLELHSDQTWRVDTGFKNGYLGKIEAMMEAKHPGCGLKASPHIESRIKTLKAKYFSLTELLALSGFEWNEEKMMLGCEESAYDETTKGKKDASGLYDKPFPHYQSLGQIYAESVGANTQQQQRNAESNTSNISRKRARVRDEMAKQFSIMAKAIADVGPKLDGLVHALSTNINLTEMQQLLDGELSKMEFLAPMELFKVTNFLAKQHDLLTVFFNMSDERKSAYVTTLLQTWMHNDI